MRPYHRVGYREITMNSSKTFETPDATLDEVREALHRYQQDHPQARVSAYRQNRFSIRLRVIDPEFERDDRCDRSDRVWAYLRQLPEETQFDLSVVLLLAPSELERSAGNVDFEHPLPSRL